MLTLGGTMPYKGGMTKKAIKALAAYQSTNDLTDTATAAALGRDRVLLWRWQNGTRKPSLDSLRRISKLTGKPLIDLL